MMNKFSWTKIFVSLVILILFSSCIQSTKLLKEGSWRGVFTLTDHEVPFLFEVTGQTAKTTTVFLVNGTDKFPLKSISYQNDSVFIPIDLYDAVLKAKIGEDQLSGRFVKLASDKSDGGVPFTAIYGKASRFAESSEKPAVSLNGTWDINFGSGERTDKTVGNFDQKGSLLTGSILTTTGDYRYLEGAVHGKKFQLSAFGGSSPYLVMGEFSSDSTFTGEFITPRKATAFTGTRNSKAALPDAYTVTYLKEGYSTIDFTFPNLEGEQVALSDQKYKGKVVVVTILGSWCPNCLDENAFLAGWYKENKGRGIEIIGLGFERKNDFESAKKSLGSLKTRLDIQYEILFAGQSGTANASNALPALNGIASFPTTIFIDKKGNVRKVHSGFNGPATGKFYEEFKVEFNELIDQLLAEN
jgi:peroxiredoxin